MGLALRQNLASGVQHDRILSQHMIIEGRTYQSDYDQAVLCRENACAPG